MTTRMAAHSIEAGEGDVFLSVGVECVSRYGSGYPDAPDTYNQKLVPGNTEEYPDSYIATGQTAENVARREKISREDQDRFAVKSQGAAVAARDNGFFDREIIPVPLPNGEMFTKDDGPRLGTTMEGLAALKPVFREDGTVTADRKSTRLNSSHITISYAVFCLKKKKQNVKIKYRNVSNDTM